MTKTALITGTTAGIGEASARRFVAGGWKVIGTGRRGDRLRALQEEFGDAFLPLEVDMQDVGAVLKLAELDGEWGGIDLLLNNAGFAPSADPLGDQDWSRLEAAIATNITGLVALTQAALPKLKASRGLIINLSSVAATSAYRGGAVYGGTKAFVRQFGFDLRCDLAGSGVRVTSIEPGMVETEFTLVRNGGDQAASDALYQGSNPITAEDLAEQFWWLANLPPHLNINALEIMPVNQSWAGFAIHRD
ncbi:SDR family NAD(P)-dependent oxidoreductase [Sphingomonas ginkgonis]|uniref:SDR family NAD(P)-dependent oxidoreductase n=1 Tax=Sphingomonas ginkgonis TaxID=2315330 RepID=A0A3R9WMD4_9SPHN|nr:SDR family NAD(P)-dependent oxidoreductase [Sphingomonas ginkgonis]RST29840.1 SDR family NAD(P)-dependent oxidoreductase [Sphingomonas ginkgonis]